MILSLAFFSFSFFFSFSCFFFFLFLLISIQGSKNLNNYELNSRSIPACLKVYYHQPYIYLYKIKFKSHPFLLSRLRRFTCQRLVIIYYSWTPAVFPKPLHSPFCYTKLELVILSWVILPRGPRYSDKSLNYYLMIDSSHWNQRWIHGSRGEISLGKSTKRDRWAFIHHAEVKLLHNIITSIAYIYFCKLHVMHLW